MNRGHEAGTKAGNEYRKAKGTDFERDNDEYVNKRTGGKAKEERDYSTNPWTVRYTTSP